MSIGHIIGLLIVGLIAGALARLLMPGKDPMGIWATILLGVAGSFLGGLIGRAILGAKDGDEKAILRPSFIFSLIGAMILLWIWRMLRPKVAG